MDLKFTLNHFFSFLLLITISCIQKTGTNKKKKTKTTEEETTVSNQEVFTRPNDNQINTSNIQKIIELKRYYKSSVPDHWTTIDVLDSGYKFEAGVNIFHPLQTRPSNTVELFSCLANEKDHFTSTNQNCENQTYIKKLGYIFDISHPNTTPLYRCIKSGNHFISTFSNCEGFKSEGLLGYAVSHLSDIQRAIESSTVLLKRYFNKNNLDHWVTTTNANSAYSIEAAVRIHSPETAKTSNMVTIYSCLVGGTNHMISTSSNCENTTLLKKLGYLQKNPFTNSVPIYRCRDKSNHFISTISNCEGHTTESLLGHALNIESIMLYFNKDTPDFASNSFDIKLTWNKIPNVTEYNLAIKLKSQPQSIESCYHAGDIKKFSRTVGSQIQIDFRGVCLSNTVLGNFNNSDIEYFELTTAYKNNWQDLSSRKIDRIFYKGNEQLINFANDIYSKDFITAKPPGYLVYHFKNHFFGYPRSYYDGNSLFIVASVANKHSFPLYGNTSIKDCTNYPDDLKTIHVMRQANPLASAIDRPILVDQDCIPRMENPEVIVKGNIMRVAYHIILQNSTCSLNGKDGRKTQLVYKDIYNYNSLSPVVSGRTVLHEICLPNGSVRGDSGFWEPFLYFDKNNNLNVLYADDTYKEGKSTCGQKIHQISFSADMLSKTNKDVGSCSGAGRRDGMPVVAKLNDSTWFMVFESLYSKSGRQNGDVILLRSDDAGLTWGNRQVIVKSQYAKGGIGVKAGTPYIQIKNGIGYVSYSIETTGEFTELHIRSINLNGMGYYKDVMVDKRFKYPNGYNGSQPEVGSLYWGSMNIVKDDLYFFGAGYFGGEFIEAKVPISLLR